MHVYVDVGRVSIHGRPRNETTFFFYIERVPLIHKTHKFGGFGTGFCWSFVSVKGRHIVLCMERNETTFFFISRGCH